jgi:hypothetical protein
MNSGTTLSVKMMAATITKMIKSLPWSAPVGAVARSRIIVTLMLAAAATVNIITPPDVQDTDFLRRLFLPGYQSPNRLYDKVISSHTHPAGSDAHSVVVHLLDANFGVSVWQSIHVVSARRLRRKRLNMWCCGGNKNDQGRSGTVDITDIKSHKFKGMEVDNKGLGGRQGGMRNVNKAGFLPQGSYDGQGRVNDSQVKLKQGQPAILKVKDVEEEKQPSGGDNLGSQSTNVKAGIAKDNAAGGKIAVDYIRDENILIADQKLLGTHPHTNSHTDLKHTSSQKLLGADLHTNSHTDLHAGINKLALLSMGSAFQSRGESEAFRSQSRAESNYSELEHQESEEGSQGENNGENTHNQQVKQSQRRQIGGKEKNESNNDRIKEQNSDILSARSKSFISDSKSEEERSRSSFKKSKLIL